MLQNKVSKETENSGPLRPGVLAPYFSLHQTIPKYWNAWKKFMMKKAWPKLLNPQV